MEREAISRNYPKSDLDAIRHRRADGSLSIHLWFNGSSDRFESMMMSMIKKIVTNKMLGKSFIQASSLGYKSIGTEIPDDGVIYREGFDFSKGLQTMHIGEDGSIQPAQVLVPFNFFDKNGKGLDIKNFTKVDANGRTIIDVTKLPDELRHFIGARIPNQGHNSMLPMEIVGFLPKNHGDLMIVPAEITKQMGSDFDVDKLFVYKKNYKHTDGVLSVYEPNTITKQGVKPSEYTNHSGGAGGSDISWDKIGTELGFERHNHYFTGERSDKNAPYGNQEISEKSEIFKEGKLEAAKAAKVTYGYQYPAMKDARLIRNWAQVKNADAVFAIGSLVLKGQKLFPSQRMDTRDALVTAVTGGTGYAVQMAINNGKPVYVFDQNRKRWFKNINGKWSDSEVPTLTPNFAGIGTREINTAGQQAIKDVYTKTLMQVNDVVSEIQENDKTLQNDYFDVHWSVLTHPEMFNKILSPLDKPDLKAEKKLAEARGGSKKIDNFFYIGNQLDDFISQKDAKMLVGMSSLSSVFNAVIQNKNLKLMQKVFNENTKKNEIVPFYITFIDEQTGNKVKLHKLSGTGVSTYYDAKEKKWLTRSKHDNITTMQNAFLDHAKDRTIDFLNLNRYTYAAAAALCMLEDENGVALNLTYVSRLLQQPIIKEYAQLMSSGGDSLSDKRLSKQELKQSMYDQLVNKYKGMLTVEELAAVLADPKAFSPQQLQEMLEKTPDMGEQLHSLIVFQQLEEVGSKIADVQSAFNQDTNGPGANLLASLDKAEKVTNLSNQVFIHGASDLANEGTQTGAAFKNTTLLANELYSPILPYHKMKGIFDEVAKQGGKDKLTLEVQREVAYNLRSYIYSLPQIGFTQDASRKRVELLYDTEAGESLAKRVSDAKRTWGNKNVFLQSLRTELAINTDQPSKVFYNATSSSVESEAENNKAFMEMLQGPEEQKLLAEDLITYTYITGGNADGKSYIKSIPIAYLVGTPIANNLNALMEKADWDVLQTGFMLQFFQHNPDRAPRLSSDLSSTLEFQQIGKDIVNRIQETVTLPKLDTNDLKATNKHLWITRTVPGGSFTEYAPTISFKHGNNWIVYQRAEMDTGFNQVYHRVDTLGDGGSLNEYDASRGYVRTSLLTNRAISSLNQDYRPSIKTRAELDKEHAELLAAAQAKHVFETEFAPEGETTVHSLMQQLTEDEAPLLELLHNISQASSKTSREIKVDGKLTIMHSAGQWSSLRTKTGKLIDPRIRLNLNHKTLKTRKDVLRVMTHEMAHHVTASTMDVIEKLGKEKALAQFGSETIEAYDRLKRLQMFLVTTLPTTERNTYATSSIDELVAHVLSDAQFQKVLNKLDYEGMTVLEKFFAIIKDLIQALAAQFDIDVRSGSALEAALNDIGILLQESGPQSQIGEEVSLTRFSQDFFGDEENEIPENMQKAITDLERLKTKLESKQLVPKKDKHNEKLRQELVQREEEIAKLDQELTFLKREASLFNLLAIGTRQMNWVETMMRKQHLTHNETMVLVEATNTWGAIMDDLNKTLNLGSIPVEAEILKGRASSLGAKVFAMFKAASVNDKGTVIRSITDFDIKNMQTDGGTGSFRDQGQVISQVGQELNDKVSSKVRRIATDSDRFTKKINKMNLAIQKYAEANNMKVADVHKMFQASEGWGAVGLFSPKFYQFQQGARKQLFDILTQANTLTDATEKAQIIKGAWKAYNTKINNNLIYVNTTVFFETESGELKTGEAVDRERAKIVAEVGEDLTATLIEQGQDQYREFLLERESQENSLRARYEERLGKPGLSAVERIQIQQEQVNEMNEWDGHNSPNVFFNALNGHFVKGINPRFRNFSRLVQAPRKKPTDGPFYDEKYAKLSDPKNQELHDIYMFWRTSMDEFKGYLPASVSKELGDNYMPILKAGTSQFSIGKAGEWLGKTITEAFTAEEDYLNHINADNKQIPLRYTSSQGVPEEERELNIMILLEKFGKMAIHYKHMAEIQSYTELLHQIVANGVTESTGGVFNRVNGSVKNLADSTSYMIDTLMYQKPKIAEAVGGKVYSMIPWEQRKAERAIVKLNDQKEALHKQYSLGELEVADYNKQRQAIDAKLADFKYRRIVGSKIGDVAIQITQIKALAYNPFSAFANISFGMVSIFVHANARTDFDQATARDAFATMLHATGRSVSLGSFDSAVAKKILALMERLGTMGELLDSDHVGDSKIKSNKSQWKKVLSPYQMLRGSDYFTKGMIAVAMAKYKKITVDGVERSLWDLMDNEAQLTDMPEWFSEDADLETDFQRFQKQAVAVTKIIMGNQDSASPMWIKKYMLGRLISQFRVSWLAEGIGTRIEKEHMNEQLGRMVKGRYRTIIELGTIGTMTTLLRQAMSVFTSVDPYTRRKRDGSALSTVDQENMRKNLAEVVFFLGMTAVVVGLKALADDDEDDSVSKKATQVVLNMLIRNRQDIEFYSSPSSASSVLENVIPAQKVIVDFQRAMKGTYRILSQDEDADNRFTQEQATSRWMKAIPYAGIYPKFKYMWDHDLDKLSQ